MIPTLIWTLRRPPRKHGRKTIGIELSPDYAQLAARRLQQLSLLAEPA
jgi:DNA modification methylase